MPFSTAWSQDVDAVNMGCQSLTCKALMSRTAKLWMSAGLRQLQTMGQEQGRDPTIQGL